MELFIKLLVTGGVMGILDFIWLGYVAKKLYYGEMGKILLDKPNMVPALLFYFIYVVGVIVFVVNPALAKDSLAHAALYGALFGLVAYATYDLTSLSVIKGFNVKIVVIDLLWGIALTTTVAVAAFMAVKAWA
jgi:uncharacterized membrane protein